MLSKNTPLISTYKVPKLLNPEALHQFIQHGEIFIGFVIVIMIVLGEAHGTEFLTAKSPQTNRMNNGKQYCVKLMEPVKFIRHKRV